MSIGFAQLKEEALKTKNKKQFRTVEDYMESLPDEDFQALVVALNVLPVSEVHRIISKDENHPFTFHYVTFNSWVRKYSSELSEMFDHIDRENV